MNLDKKAIEYLKNNITKIKKISKEDNELYYSVNYKDITIHDIRIEEIKYWSKDANDLEAILIGAKFGI